MSVVEKVSNAWRGFIYRSNLPPYVNTNVALISQEIVQYHYVLMLSAA